MLKKKYQKIMKGVEEMLNPTLELKHKQIAKEAATFCLSYQPQIAEP